MSTSTEHTQQKKLKIALCQVSVTADKQKNIQNAVSFIANASSRGAHLVVLPECFNCPYGNKYFEEYAENFDYDESTSSASEVTLTESMAAISAAAKQHSVFVVAGSLPTRENGKLFNTSTVFDTEGRLITCFRKVHLFDVNVPGKIVFQESLNLTPGNKFAVFDTPFAFDKIGVGICFDIRFAEMAQLYQRSGCKLLIYPGAFNMTTGPAHWELLARARALDNQLYVAVCSPARDTQASYVAWGHSLVADPWGTVIAEADETEQIVFAELDADRISEVREQIPVLKNKRNDLYTVTQK